MKRHWFIATLALSAVCPTPGRAVVPVVCANCSEQVTSLLSYARQAEQLANEVSQLKTQLAQYSNMVTNTVSLPQSIWSQVYDTVYQVRNLANQASLLTGNSGGIMNRLNSAQGLAYQAFGTPEAAYGNYTTGRQTIGNAVSSLGRTLGVQQSQELQYARLQEDIQRHSQNAEGQKQAIQAGNELMALNSTQLNQIQTTLTAQAQLMATKVETDADRTALNDYAMRQFATAPVINTHGGNTYP